MNKPVGKMEITRAEPIPAAEIEAKAIELFTGRDSSLAVRNLVDLRQVAEILCRGGLAAGKTVEKVMCAIMVGHELGIGPANSVQQLYVTPQGKVEAEVGMLLALAQRSPAWRGYSLAWEGKLEDRTLKCTATIRREGCPDVVSDMDLQRAAAWSWLTPKKSADGRDQNIWNKDPRLMLENRAISWGIKKQFSDCVTGIFGKGEISGEVDANA